MRATDKEEDLTLWVLSTLGLTEQVTTYRSCTGTDDVFSSKFYLNTLPSTKLSQYEKLESNMTQGRR